MMQDLKVFIIFAFFSIASYLVMRLAFGKDKYSKPQLFAFIGFASVAVFTHSAYLVFLYVFLLKVLYLKNDVEKNVLFFLFLYPFLQMNVIVPFLSPGSIYLIDLNFQRILSLFLLFPLVFSIRASDREDVSYLKFDIFFLLLSVIFLVSFFRESSAFEVTTFFSIREVLGYILDVIIPYFILSRALYRFEQTGVLARSIVFGGLIVAVSALIEAGLGWRFYHDMGTSLSDYMFATYENAYEVRGGVLRVSSSLGHPITLGFYLSIVVGFTMFLSAYEKVSVLKKLLVFSIFGLAIFATGSRGAWVGGALLLSTYVFYSFNRAFRKVLFFQLLVLGATLSFVYFNPAVFSNETKYSDLDSHGTFEYRAQLAEVALEVIPENLMWGSKTYRDHPKMQELIQGQGIIDMVNGYINITIEYGLVAFLLFVAMLFKALITGARWVAFGDDLENKSVSFLGVALISILLSLSLQLAFTSFSSFIVLYIWIVFALARNLSYILGNSYIKFDEPVESDT